MGRREKKLFSVSTCRALHVRGGVGKARPSFIATTPIVSGSVSKPSNRSPSTDSVSVQRVSAFRSAPIRLCSPHRRSAWRFESRLAVRAMSRKGAGGPKPSKWRKESSVSFETWLSGRLIFQLARRRHRQASGGAPRGRRVPRQSADRVVPWFYTGSELGCCQKPGWRPISRKFESGLFPEFHGALLAP